MLAGEPQWVEVRSPNFSVVTDAGEKRGREVAMRFEQMRGVFGALMTKANVNLPVPLQIVAFRNTKEMRQVAPLFNGKPTQLAGLFQGGSDRSFIMLDMSVENPWVVVFHEYAHQLMNGNAARLNSPPGLKRVLRCIFPASKWTAKKPAWERFLTMTTRSCGKSER